MLVDVNDQRLPFQCFTPSRDVFLFFSGDIAGGGHEQPPKVSGQPWNPLPLGIPSDFWKVDPVPYEKR